MFKADIRLNHIPLLFKFLFIAPTNSPVLTVQLASPVEPEPAKNRAENERGINSRQSVALRPDKALWKATVISKGIDACG